ncbi:MAG: cytochrome-c peroxidase, partial [Bacteroidales bacterium]|nr:cytochrome-c peroxidase [Bacteroidales bacterium]
MSNTIKIIFLFVLFFASCATKIPETVYQPVPYDIGVPMFPDSLNIPPDNPMTVDGVRLGRYLFYDGRLSGDPARPMSCATCHKQEHAFECGAEDFPDGRPVGNSGQKTPHVMLPFINLVWNNSGYFWNGRIQEGNIEQTVPMAITAPHEMDGNINKAVKLIKSDARYKEMFYRAFGS